MNCKDYKRMSIKELEELKFQAIYIGNYQAANEISDFIEFYGKDVIVNRGRKVPKGTTGTVFWIGSFDNSKHGDPWGIYTTRRVGIKDKNGEVFFTNLENVDIVK